MLFPEYVPIVDPVGLDLNYMLDYCTSWFTNHSTPYVGLNLYPPLAMVLFKPLLLVDRWSAFEIVTALTLLAYTLTALIIPALIVFPRKDISIIALFFVLGLFSCGFHFELEKGQFNLIAFFFCSLGIYLFHRKPQYRYLSYILLTILIQLKIYPAIFLLMMIDDWVDWKTNLKRFFALAAFNFLLLFAGGYCTFQDFIKAIQRQMINPNMAITNHSVKVFTQLLFRKIGFQEYFLGAGLSQNQIRSLVGYSWIIEIAIMGVISLCLLAILVKSYRLKLPGLNAYTFLACTIGMLVIPAVSNDYKLPLLTAPMAMLMLQPLQITGNIPKTILVNIIKFSITLAYMTTLFSYTNKPLFMQNNLPALLFILLALTIMVILEKPTSNIFN
jgi:hypothetical protein